MSLMNDSILENLLSLILYFESSFELIDFDNFFNLMFGEKKLPRLKSCSFYGSIRAEQHRFDDVAVHSYIRHLNGEWDEKEEQFIQPVVAMRSKQSNIEYMKLGMYLQELQIKFSSTTDKVPTSGYKSHRRYGLE